MFHSSIVRKTVSPGLSRFLNAFAFAILAAFLVAATAAPTAAQITDRLNTTASGKLSHDQEAALKSALHALAPGIGDSFDAAAMSDVKRIQKGRALFASRGGLANLDSLSEAQREDLAAYYQDVLNRARNDAASLEPADRSALAAFQDYVRRQGVTPPYAGVEPQKTEPQKKTSDAAAPAPARTGVRPQAGAKPSSRSAAARPAPSPGQGRAPAADASAGGGMPGAQDASKTATADSPSLSPEAAKQFMDDLNKQKVEEQGRRDKAHLKNLYGGEDALPKPLPGDMEGKLKEQAKKPVPAPNKSGAQQSGASAPTKDEPNPPNRFAGLNDSRRGWLPAAKPPTEAEIKAYPKLFLEGNWRIEWRGHPKFASARIWITEGYKLDSDCGLHGVYESCRDPSAPLSLHGDSVRRHDGRYVGYGYAIKVSPNGKEIHVEHSSNSDGTPTSVLRRQPGNPNILIGTWKDGDGKTGAEIWRREPRPEIMRFVCHGRGNWDNSTAGASGRPCLAIVRGSADAHTMRGNLPGLTIDILGPHMRGAGPLPVFLDWEKTHAEVGGYCYLYEKPFSSGEQHGCASWGNPSPQYGEIVGLRVTMNVAYGARPGIKTLWIGGKPVRFDLRLPDFPKVAQSLDVIAPSGEALKTIDELKPFALKAVFDDAPEAETISVDAPHSQIALHRTKDPNVFRSGPLAVKHVEPTGDQDRLSFSRTIAGHNADRSAEIAKKLAKRWSVQQTAAAGGGSTGAATVSSDGRRIALTLSGPKGERRFESFEIDAEEITLDEAGDLTQSKGPKTHNKMIATVRFEEVPAPPQQSKGKGAASSKSEPLTVLSVPRTEKTLAFKLQDKTAARPIAWNSGSGRFRVQLDSKTSEDRLEGPWYEETEKQHLSEAGRQIWTAGAPKVAGVVVLEDQLGASSAKGAVTPTIYPFKPDGGTNAGSRWRTLFVYGRNLPNSGQPVDLQSDDATIEYQPAFFDKTQEKSLLDEGWKKLGDKRGKNDSALLVRAKLKEKVTPGVKKLTLSGQAGFWPLIFSDQLAVMRFVRAGGEGERDATDVFYTSDMGVVELKYKTAIPFKQINIHLFKGTKLSADGKLKDDDARVGVVVAKPVSDGDGKTFHTQSIHFYRSDISDHRPPDDPKAKMLDVRPKQVIKARLEDRVQGIAIPPVAQATIYSSPDQLTQSPLWEDALRATARCYNETPDESSVKDGGYARQKAKAYSSAFLSDKYSISLTKGDQAAAILIRDEFVKQTKKRLPEYKSLANTPVAIKQFREAARRFGDAEKQAFWNAFTADFVKKNTLINTTDTIPLWQTLDTAWLAQYYKITPAEAEARAFQATQKALKKQPEFMQQSIDRANAAGDCNLDELLVIAGYNSPLLVNAIVPRLVKLKETTNPHREFWAPDNLARGYVRGLYVAGEAVRALDRYAELRKITAFSLAAIAAPVGLAAVGASATAAGAGVAIDVADAAYFGGSGLMKYYSDAAKLDYAVGAAPVAGNDFYGDIASSRQSGLATIAGVALPVGFAAAGAKAVRAIKGMELLKTRPSVLSNLDTLSSAERRSVSAYLDEVANAGKYLRIKDANGATRAAYDDLRKLADDVATSGSEGGAKAVSAADQRLLQSVQDHFAKEAAKKNWFQRLFAKKETEQGVSVVDSNVAGAAESKAASEGASASSAASASRRNLETADLGAEKPPSSSSGQPAASEPSAAPSAPTGRKPSEMTPAERQAFNDAKADEAVRKATEEGGPVPKYDETPTDGASSKTDVIKRPSEMTREERQAYNDRKAARAVREKRDAKLEVADENDVLPGPSEPAVGARSKDISDEELQRLFEPGRDLTPEELTAKADIYRARDAARRAAQEAADNGRPVSEVQALAHEYENLNNRINVARQAVTHESGAPSASAAPSQPSAASNPAAPSAGDSTVDVPPVDTNAPTVIENGRRAESPGGTSVMRKAQHSAESPSSVRSGSQAEASASSETPTTGRTVGEGGGDTGAPMPGAETPNADTTPRGTADTQEPPASPPSGGESAATVREPMETPGTQRLSNRPGETEPAGTEPTPIETPGTQRLSNRPGETEPGETAPIPVETPGTVRLSDRSGGSAPEIAAQPSSEIPDVADPGIPSTGRPRARSSREIWEDSVGPSRINRRAEDYLADHPLPPNASHYAERALSPVKTSHGIVTDIERDTAGGAIWRTAEGERFYRDAKLLGNGGYADTSRLLDKDRGPTGLVMKEYSPNTGDFGVGGKRYDPNRPSTPEMQQKVVEDSVYGASLLKDADILQAELVGYEVTPKGGYLIQREVGGKVSLPPDVEEEFIIKSRLEKNIPLSEDEQNAVADLFDKLDEHGIGWEDPNWGNVFIRRYKDGRVEAGINDTDRIGIWNDLREPRDLFLMQSKDYYRRNPKNSRFPHGKIQSMEPDGIKRFGSVKQFNDKMRELKGYWKYDRNRGFEGGFLNSNTIRERFPELPDYLPENMDWPHWANPPSGAAPKKHGMLSPENNVIRFAQRAGPPRTVFDRGPPLWAGSGARLVAIAA